MVLNLSNRGRAFLLILGCLAVSPLAYATEPVSVEELDGIGIESRDHCHSLAYEPVSDAYESAERQAALILPARNRALRNHFFNQISSSQSAKGIQAALKAHGWDGPSASPDKAAIEARAAKINRYLEDHGLHEPKSLMKCASPLSIKPDHWETGCKNKDGTEVTEGPSILESSVLEANSGWNESDQKWHLLIASCSLTGALPASISGRPVKLYYARVCTWYDVETGESKDSRLRIDLGFAYDGEPGKVEMIRFAIEDKLYLQCMSDLREAYRKRHSYSGFEDSPVAPAATLAKPN